MSTETPKSRLSRKHLMMAGFTLMSTIVVVAIIGILMSIAVPVAGCEIQRAKMTTVLADLSFGASLIEAFEIEHGTYPNTLEELYANGAVPADLIYCYDNPDGNSGHGNEICAFFDDVNPSGNNEHGGIPSLGFLLSTTPNLAPCKDFSFAWTYCCGREPVTVPTDEPSNMPGHPGNVS